ncbi:MAG TPA: hypothetical protein VH307_03960 [Streptosporangiaceae bacterium]|jgi:hypothetical protein|nr:hypothetical protein [Streptosporangiaceae bacterium]
MIQVIRRCPDCGWDRLFERHHTAAGNCPDSPDGDCPEWSCTDCGAALLFGFNSPLHDAVETLEWRDRVA